LKNSTTKWNKNAIFLAANLQVSEPLIRKTKQKLLQQLLRSNALTPGGQSMG